jgi:molybdenum cofactor cytidylyltransferase
MIVALLPACGQSRRMGRPKLLLPIGTQTVLEGVIQAVRTADIDRVLVVTTDIVPQLAQVAAGAGAAVATLAEETADMRATVEIGLKWIEETWSPEPADTWLLVPADHPTLDASVIRQLLAAEQANPLQSVFVPTYDGRRGHPTLIRWQHVAAIRAFPPGQGLNHYFRRQVDQVCEVPVDSATVLCDLDTPEDYARLTSQGFTP